MTPVDFLYTELNAIAREFPQVHIKYDYNELIRTHIVVLLPLEEYRDNKALDDRWIPVSFRFQEIFPNQDIAFVSSDSTLDMDIPTMEWNKPVGALDVWNNIIYDSVTDQVLDYYFSTEISIDTVLIGPPIANMLSFPTLDLSQTHNTDSDYQAAA
jgi:hypothetical protein